MPVHDDRYDHTLVELANRMQDKRLQEILLKTGEHELLKDIRFVEANGGLVHKEAMFEALPEATFGSLGGFWPDVKATSRQITEPITKTGQYSSIPVDIAQATGNPAGYRKQEDLAVIEGITSSVAEKVIYGNRMVNVDEPLGLANRLNSASMANVIDAGGTNSDDGLTSIYVLKHDPRTFFGIYEQGSKAGMRVRDLSEKTDTDPTTGGKRQVYRTLFEWSIGIMVRDPRYVWRVANIPVPADGVNDAAFKKWNRALIYVLNHIPRRDPSAISVYMNADALTQLDIMNMEPGNSNYVPKSPDGETPASYRGIPLRKIDEICSTEEQVV